MRYKTLFTLLLLCIICVPTVYVLARVQKSPAKSSQTSSASHEAVKAEIINSDPAHFTIDVHTMANLGVNEEAPTFALYTSENPPANCPDFSNLDLPYKKPEEHKRQFDLSEHEDVLKALEKHHCVVVRNKAG
ncbi:MAG: hypothetical protein DYH13_09195 [Alphaproteobacteria bacterium PRO2]|nr:hypothetical protein [Alphaproteobacteria bacterium PRO2]